jgi:hypothetical protein
MFVPRIADLVAVEKVKDHLHAFVYHIIIGVIILRSGRG